MRTPTTRPSEPCLWKTSSVQARGRAVVEGFFDRAAHLGGTGRVVCLNRARGLVRSCWERPSSPRPVPRWRDRALGLLGRSTSNVQVPSAAPAQRARQQPPGTMGARERRFHHRAPNVAARFILDEEDQIDRAGPRSPHPSGDTRVEISKQTVAVEVEEEDTGNAGDRPSGLARRVGRDPRGCRDLRSSVARGTR